MNSKPTDPRENEPVDEQDLEAQLLDDPAVRKVQEETLTDLSGTM